jgi:hypothetical protein
VSKSDVYGSRIFFLVFDVVLVTLASTSFLCPNCHYLPFRERQQPMCRDLRSKERIISCFVKGRVRRCQD